MPPPTATAAATASAQFGPPSSCSASPPRPVCGAAEGAEVASSTSTTLDPLAAAADHERAGRGPGAERERALAERHGVGARLLHGELLAARGQGPVPGGGRVSRVAGDHVAVESEVRVAELRSGVDHAQPRLTGDGAAVAICAQLGGLRRVARPTTV